MKRFDYFIPILVGLLLLGACGRTNSPIEGGGNPSSGGKPGAGFGKPEKPKFKIPVTVQQVKRERMYAYLQAMGTIVPIKEVELKPEMTGRIYFTKKWLEGDEVKKGDIIASIDDRELKLDIQEAELQLELAKSNVIPASANLAQAEKDEEFKKAMYERGAISKYEYDQAKLQTIQRKNQLESAMQNIVSRENALKKLKQELEKIEIIVPFDGVLLPAKQSIVNTQKEGGETDLSLLHNLIVSTGTVICRLANIDKVYLALDVPAKDLELVKIGQPVEVEVYTRSSTLYKGTVAEISTALNANTRTYTVNVLLENPNHELRPGMFAKARIITEERLDAISIPRELVMLRNNEQVVFVVKEKPQDEIRDATDEIRIPTRDSESKRTELAMAGGGLERIAMASEFIDEPTETVQTKEPEIEMIAEKRVVTIGIENRERVEIVDGLQAGDYLVVLGYETLSDGVDVNVAFRNENDFEQALLKSQ